MHADEDDAHVQVVLPNSHTHGSANRPAQHTMSGLSGQHRLRDKIRNSTGTGTATHLSNPEPPTTSNAAEKDAAVWRDVHDELHRWNEAGVLVNPDELDNYDPVLRWDVSIFI